jgi:hypothetical protein
VLGAGYLLSGGTAKNSLCLGGNLANTYAPLASPSFTTCITTPVIKLTSISAKTSETTIAYIKSDGTILSGTSAGGGTWGSITGTLSGQTDLQTCFNGKLASGGTAVCATTAGNALALCGCIPSCFLGAGATALCATTAGNALSLGGNLANTYAPKASPVFTTCATIPTPFLLGAVQVNATGTEMNYLVGVTSLIQTQLNAKAPLTNPTFTGVITSNDNVNSLSRTTFNNTSVGASSRADLSIVAGTKAIYLGVDNGSGMATPAYFDNRSSGIFGYYYNGTRQLTIDTAGNVGIGIASPGNNLHILGSNPSYGFLKLQSTTTGEVSINYKDCNGTDELAWTVGKGAGGIGDAFGWYWNGVDRMQLSTAGVLCAATCGISLDWVATSDCRLKTCIKPIMGALSTVMCLQGVCYELCDDGKHLNQLGLLAQDVQPILPAIVSHSQPSEADAKYGITDEKLGISYGKISVILIEAIKEQQKQIEENKKQIRALCLELNYMRNYNK